MFRWLGNVADYEGKATQQIEQQIENSNYTFVGHTFVTRNSSQANHQAFCGGGGGGGGGHGWLGTRLWQNMKSVVCCSFKFAP